MNVKVHEDYEQIDKENHKCCLECEKFECCIGVCETPDNYEYTEECPDYVKESEDAKSITDS